MIRVGIPVGDSGGGVCFFVAALVDLSLAGRIVTWRVRAFAYLYRRQTALAAPSPVAYSHH